MISSVRFDGVGVAIGFDGVGRANMRSGVSVGSCVWGMVLAGVDDGMVVFVASAVIATAGVTKGGAGEVHATEPTTTKTRVMIRQLTVFMPSVYNDFVARTSTPAQRLSGDCSPICRSAQGLATLQQ